MFILVALIYIAVSSLIIFSNGLTNYWGLSEGQDRDLVMIFLPIAWPMMLPIGIVIFIIYHAYNFVFNSGEHFRKKLRS